MSARAIVRRWLLRTGMLVLWTLALWGTLLLFLTLVDVVGVGPRRALGRLLPSPGDSAWVWVNALSVGWALVVGIVAGGMLAWGVTASSRGRPRSRRPEE